jgi:thioredoxin-like negative regulator of GroEL
LICLFTLVGFSSVNVQAAENPKTDTEEETASEVPSAVWLETLDEAVTDARLQGKPIFAIVGAPWCGYCKQLEQEIRGATENEIASDFVLLHLNADFQIQDARSLNANALPALRILSMDGDPIADRDGYLPPENLLQWLKDNQDGAAPDAPSVLSTPMDQLDDEGLTKLIAKMSARNVTTRRIVLQRLSGDPQRVAAAVVDRFENASLADRLSALQLLQQWEAPTEGLDPWVPTSIDNQAVGRLRKWQRQFYPRLVTPRKQEDAPENADVPISDEEREQLKKQISRWLQTPRQRVVAEMSDLANRGPVIAEIAQHMLADDLAPGAKSRLRHLMYSAAAGNELRLRNSGLLRVLADGKPRDRRAAAQEINSLATSDDVALLASLLKDPDPLVRELATASIVSVAPQGNLTMLTALLSDPGPNVRASVLKQLAMQQDDRAIDQVVSYMDSEPDDDLVIYAIRYLRSTNSQLALPGLQRQMKSKSWQVRAAAIEAIGEVFEGQSLDTEPQADIAKTILAAVDDPDSFVSAKAAAQMGSVIDSRNIQQVFDVLIRRPALISTVAESVAENGDEVLKATIQEVRKRMETEQPETIRVAVALMDKIGQGAKLDIDLSGAIDDSQLIASAGDQEPRTRLVTLRMIANRMHRAVMSQASQLPAFVEPEEVFGSQKFTTAGSEDSGSADSDQRASRRATSTGHWIDQQPFQSSTGLVDLASELNLDSITLASIKLTEPAGNGPLRRVDEFFGIESKPSVRKKPLAPPAQTVRQLFTALDTGQPILGRAYRTTMAFKPLASSWSLNLDHGEAIPSDASSDVRLLGYQAAIQAMCLGQSTPPETTETLVAWAGSLGDDQEQSADADRNVLIATLKFLSPEPANGNDSPRERVLHVIRSFSPASTPSSNLLSHLAWPPGESVYELLWRVFEDELADQDGVINDKSVAAFLVAFKISLGDAMSIRYQWFENYMSMDHQVPPLAKQFKTDLLERCQHPDDAIARMALAILANRDLPSAKVVAERWLKGSSTSDLRRHTAASVIVIAAERVAQKASELLTQLLDNDDEVISKLGLYAAAGQGQLLEGFDRSLGLYPQIKYTWKFTSLPESERLIQYASSDQQPESSVASAILILSGHQPDRPIDDLIRLTDLEADRARDLLVAVIAARDRDEDAKQLERISKYVQANESSYEVQRFSRLIKSMKSGYADKLRRSVQPSEHSFYDVEAFLD